METLVLYIICLMALTLGIVLALRLPRLSEKIFVLLASLAIIALAAIDKH